MFPVWCKTIGYWKVIMCKQRRITKTCCAQHPKSICVTEISSNFNKITCHWAYLCRRMICVWGRCHQWTLFPKCRGEFHLLPLTAVPAERHRSSWKVKIWVLPHTSWHYDLWMKSLDRSLEIQALYSKWNIWLWGKETECLLPTWSTAGKCSSTREPWSAQEATPTTAW